MIAETPAERAKNLFFDPSRGSGLTQAGGAFQVGHNLRMLFAEGGGLRGAATGTTFNLTGRPSTEWLVAPENDVGLPAFYDQLEQATIAERPGPRGTALARALLALGGTLAVLEDAGDPAHVRNDFRGAYLGRRRLEPVRSRLAVRALRRRDLRAGGRARRGGAGQSPDGDGLHHRGRSAGAGGSHAAPVLLGRHAARARRRRSADDRGRGDARRARVAAVCAPVAAAPGSRGDGQHPLRLRVGRAGDAPTAHRRRLLAYLRVPGRVRFFLDRAVYQDSARALLPEIGAYAAGLVDHLFRADIHLEIKAGSVAVSVTGARGIVRKGEVRLYVEDASGRRSAFASVPASTTPSTLTIPAGARRIAAALRGEDDAGELVAVAEQPVL